MPGSELGVGHADRPSGRSPFPPPQIWPHTRSVSPSCPGTMLSTPAPYTCSQHLRVAPGLCLFCPCLPGAQGVPGPPAPLSSCSHCLPPPSTPAADSSIRPSHHILCPQPCLTPLHPPSSSLSPRAREPSSGWGGVRGTQILFSDLTRVLRVSWKGHRPNPCGPQQNPMLSYLGERGGVGGQGGAPVPTACLAASDSPHFLHFAL